MGVLNIYTVNPGSVETPSNYRLAQVLGTIYGGANIEYAKSINFTAVDSIQVRRYYVPATGVTATAETWGELLTAETHYMLTGTVGNITGVTITDADHQNNTSYKYLIIRPGIMLFDGNQAADISSSNPLDRRLTQHLWFRAVGSDFSSVNLSFKSVFTDAQKYGARISWYTMMYSNAVDAPSITHSNWQSSIGPLAIYQSQTTNTGNYLAELWVQAIPDIEGTATDGWEAVKVENYRNVYLSMIMIEKSNHL